jgi:cold shock CspA family protein
MTEEGRILRWVPARAFGFIHVPGNESGDDGTVFVHQNDLVRAGIEGMPKIGTKVLFERGKRVDGRSYAKNVRLADEGVPKPENFFKQIQKAGTNQ